MEKKPFWESQTFWSLIGSAVGVVAPKYSSLISQSTGDIIALIGIISGFIGRVRATKQLGVKKNEQ